jgi:hypothetical protein
MSMNCQCQSCIMSSSTFFHLMVEPRSIKIIEHTVIPVIKFSTKDTKSESLQLDISFDSKGHQGIQAVNFVKGTIEVRSQN